MVRDVLLEDVLLRGSVIVCTCLRGKVLEVSRREYF